jgi:hypothetical protein
MKGRKVATTKTTKKKKTSTEQGAAKAKTHRDASSMEMGVLSAADELATQTINLIQPVAGVLSAVAKHLYDKNRGRISKKLG